MFDVISLLKYIMEGLAVAVAIYLIPSKKIDYMDILLIGLTAAAIFAILDQFSPYVAVGTRQGTGFMIGYQQIGMGDEPSNICPMKGDKVTYSDDVIESDREKYVCNKMGDQCSPMIACKKTTNCEFVPEAMGNEDIKGMSCELYSHDNMDDCRLVKKDVEGFEGFSK